jgi:transposase
MGADGLRFLAACYAPDTPAGIWSLAAVQVLRRVWVQQFYAPAASGLVRWREPQDQPPSAQLILSPYDPEAHQCTHGEVGWVGYKAHLTETCDADLPHLITHTETTLATTQDEQVLEPIHTALAARALLPAEHLVDAGYVDSVRLRDSKHQYGVDLVGPLPADSSWQARAKAGYAAADFAVDWAAQQVRCPAGQVSTEWKAAREERGQAVIRVEFARATCAGCAVRAQCTKSTKGGRQVTLRPQEQHEALVARRAAQQLAAFKAAYAGRAGVEGTISQGVRLGDLRQTRYWGLAKTRLQHICIAVALNLVRLVAWWRGEQRATTRTSAFAALAFRARVPGAAAAA